MNDERRLRKRVNLSVYLAATDTSLNHSLGHLIDISAAGFLLLTDQVINNAQALSINIKLPETIEGLDIINCIAQVIRSKPSPNPQFFEVAFEITYASSQAKRIIEVLQQQWHLHLPN
jgi:hypothetical protein